MKIKTSELSGAQLDWAVAECEGLLAFGYETDGERLWTTLSTGETELFAPDINWAQGGPIIEREGISLYLDTNNLWQANIFDGNPAVFGSGIEGETLLIAAMRCYVASKLGDEIELPVELGAEVS